MDHLRKALSHSKYCKWAIDRTERRLSKLTNEGSNSANTQYTTGTKPTSNEVRTKGHIVIPYTQGLCKSIKKVYIEYSIQTHFKGNGTIKNILVPPKDKDPMENKSGAIYLFQCGDLVSDEEYIGETSRTFGERTPKGTLPYTQSQLHYWPHYQTGQLQNNRKGEPLHCQKN